MVRRPLLPDGVDRLALHDLKVSDATASLTFRCQVDGLFADILGKADGICVEVLA